MSEQIRLVIADDQALVRGALAALLELEGDLAVVGTAGDGEEALRVCAEVQPDVCLMDIQMPGLDGIAATRELSATTRVLIVTTFARPGYLREALEAGASGFVVKDAPAEQLADAVRRVHQGLRVVDPTLAAESLFEGANPLSERERQVLDGVVAGKISKVIARELDISTKTVELHRSRVMAKMEATSVVHLPRMVMVQRAM